MSTSAWRCTLTWCPRDDVIQTAQSGGNLSGLIVRKGAGYVCANPTCRAPVQLPPDVRPDQLPKD